MSDRVPLALMDDALHDIAGRAVRLGTDPVTARAQVLDELAPAWAEHAGRENARRAHDGLMAMSADDLLTRDQRATREAGLARLDAVTLQRAEQSREEWAVYQRRHFGMTDREASRHAVREIALAVGLMAVAFAIAVGGLLIVAQGAQAAERGDRFKDLATCGTTAMDDPRYETRCRQFSRTERSVVRSYDGPGAGAPREWERPREWE